ncbi:S8 family serine peptidase, partial [bacterium]|nr:S8 family serine peptidase [bacterium]
MYRTILIFIAFGLFSASAQAVSLEKISVSLQEELHFSRADSMISAIVHLSEQADISALDQQLYNTKASRSYRHQVIVEALQYAADVSQGELLAALDELKERGDVGGYTPFWITNCIVVQAYPRILEELSDRYDVQWLERNFRVELIEPFPGKGPVRGTHLDDNHGIPAGIRAIGAPRVWYELGITGAGRLVGNIDTGVDGTHPALTSRWRGNFAPADECWRDAVGTTSFPRDLEGHGTHVMGTMCGNSEITNDSIGVAPNARWIACNAIDQSSGVNFDNDIIDAFQWFSDPDGNSFTVEDVPDVVQNSWGIDGRFPGYDDCYNVWNNAIINCEAAGVVVTYSAGNEGPGSRTCRSPATVAIDSVTMFAVGAVDATNYTVPPYPIASFSSRGPSDCPPFTAIKPEVCAPGVAVYSSIPGGHYGQENWDGTSMAGPHVAGIVALMRQACPDADVRDIKSILMRTAHDYGAAGEDNNYGFGFVDAYEAVLQISVGRGRVEGTVRDNSTSEPISGAAVEAILTGRNARTNEEGFYRMSLIGDSTWTLQYSAFGYDSQTFDVEIITGDTVEQDVFLIPVSVGTLFCHIIAGDSVPVEGALVAFPGTPLSPQVTDSLGTIFVSMPGETAYPIHVSYQDVELDTTASIITGVVTEMTLALQSPRSQPTGPDAYGYISFDRFDYGNAAVFDWVEISPMLGGNGTIINLPNRDSSGYVEMPFPFYFYGQVFYNLTVNENGWLSPGISHDHSFFNFTIPGLQGPSGMLAPFWDNLHDGSDGEVSYVYDSENCRFIVEYYNMQLLPPTSTHMTFQVQIYSSNARPTPTGDCEIVYLYKRLDVADAATVGIENPAETIGLQLLYNNNHNPSTWLIDAGAAMRLTTRSSEVAYGSLNGQITAYPPPPDMTEAIVYIGCDEIYPDETGSFEVDSVVDGLNRPEVYLNGYEVGTVEVMIAGDSTSTIAFEIWRLDPPRELSASREDSNVTLQWLPPESVQGIHLDAFQEYNLYRNDTLIAQVADTFYEDRLPHCGEFEYFVEARYDGGVSDASNHVTVILLSVEDGSLSSLPKNFELASPYPNPFNATTVIPFALPRASHVRLTIYDILGRQVTKLTDNTYSPGLHHLIWKADGAATGLYFVKMETDEFHQVRKVLLLR